MWKGEILLLTHLCSQSEVRVPSLQPLRQGISTLSRKPNNMHVLVRAVLGKAAMQGRLARKLAVDTSMTSGAMRKASAGM